MEALGLAANVAGLAGLDAFRLISMTVEAAKTVRRNKRACLELARLVEQVGDLLQALQEQPGVTVMQRPETSAPLRELEETLRRACVLVQSCQSGGYARRFCAGKELAGRLRDVQSRISIYLQLFPIISHIDSTRLLVRVMADGGGGATRPPRSERNEDELVQTSLTNTHLRFQKFSFSQLVHATNDFSFEQQMEQGALSSLYKGRLHRSDVTIKRLSVSGQQLPECVNEYELFKNEIKILPEIQHANIVKLVGYCAERSERVSVYQYMQNGSLEDVIFGRMRAGLALDWPSRFRIIEGIAHGVDYLHNHSRLRIIHRDLKPSNILLDSDMNPRISNFDLAEILTSGVDRQKADRVIGSIGFIAPEYMREGVFSVKTDVYSFGVVVLEIISGKRWTQPIQERFYRDLLTWAWADVNRPSCCGTSLARRLKEFVHPSLHDVSFCSRALPHCLSFPARRRVLSQQRGVRSCVRAALLCIQEKPGRRPAMPEVIQVLRPRKARVPRPHRSRYTGKSSLYAGDRSAAA